MDDFVLVRRMRAWPGSYAIIALICFGAAAIAFTSGGVLKIVLGCVLAVIGIQGLAAVFYPRFRYRRPGG